MLNHVAQIRVFTLILAVMAGGLMGAGAHAQNIYLKSGTIDPASAEYRAAASTQAKARTPLSGEQRIVLVQWAEGLSEEKLVAFSEAGGTLIQYIPNNAYLAMVPPEGLDTAKFAGRGGVEPQWISGMATAWKAAPPVSARLAEWRAAVAAKAGADKVAEANKPSKYLIMLGKTGIEEAYLAELESRLGIITLHSEWDHYNNYHVTATAEQIEEILADNIVIWVEPDYPKTLFGERGGLSLTRNADPDLACVSLADNGYLGFLERYGITGSLTTISVVDSGLSQGEFSNEPGSIHPDFLGRVVGIQNGTTTDLLGDDGSSGHGTLVASVILGKPAVDTNLVPGGLVDADGFKIGQGVAPDAKVFATKIFNNAGAPAHQPLNVLVRAAYQSGARISNNSWGVDDFGAYSMDSQLYDRLTRDADIAPGLQEMLFVFAAGNAGPFQGSIGSPATAKNVISVGATENCDEYTFPCVPGLGNSIGPEADDQRDITVFSSRGPLNDGRLSPTVVAPGSHIFGAVSDSPNISPEDMQCVPFTFQPGTNSNPFGLNYSAYRSSDGTSFAAPIVTGATALIRDYYLIRSDRTTTPTPSLIKATLVNNAQDIAGGSLNSPGQQGALGNVPNNHQGFGRAYLESLFEEPGLPPFFINQSTVFRQNGEQFTIRFQIVDPSKPLRVTLAWTDAVGAVLAQPVLVNDLDLIVFDGENSYFGNNFAGGQSVPGDVRDALNNVETFTALPPHDRLIYDFTIRATSLNGDALPGEGANIEQDFSFIAQNVTTTIDTRARIEFDRALYDDCEANVQVTLTDLDRRGAGSLSLIARSLRADDQETLSLVETGFNSGIYTGTITLNQTPFPIPGSGLLSVLSTDTLRATYIDPTDGQTVTSDASVDCRIVVDPNLPDLVVTDTRLSTTTVNIAQGFQLEMTHRNLGLTDAGPYRFKVFASPDSLVTGGGNDIELFTGFSEGLVTSGSLEFTEANGQWVQVSLNTLGTGQNQDLPDGTYYIGIFIDDDNGVAEVNETNNITVLGSTITAFSVPPGAVTGPEPEVEDIQIPVLTTGPALGEIRYGFESIISTVATGVRFVRTGNFNGDNLPDVVALMPGSGNLAWIPNLGNGGDFGNPQANMQLISAGLQGATSMAVGDVNNDGLADVAVTTGGEGAGAVRLFINGGFGGFTTLILSSTPQDYGAVAIGDINGDGRGDVVAGSNTEGSLFGYLNASTLIFVFNEVEFRTDAAGITDLAIRDMNSDGRPDLVYTQLDDNIIAVALNAAEDPFNEEIEAFNVEGTAPARILTGDFNGDGSVDIVGAMLATGDVTVVPGTGGGVFGAPQVVTTVAGLSAIGQFDVNVDGRTDLLVASNTGNTVQYFRAEGAGGFVGPTLVSASASGVVTLAAADLDGDGMPDVVSGLPITNRIIWNRNLRLADQSAERFKRLRWAPAENASRYDVQFVRLPDVQPNYAFQLIQDDLTSEPFQLDIDDFSGPTVFLPPDEFPDIIVGWQTPGTPERGVVEMYANGGEGDQQFRSFVYQEVPYISSVLAMNMPGFLRNGISVSPTRSKTILTTMRQAPDQVIVEGDPLLEFDITTELQAVGFEYVASAGIVLPQTETSATQLYIIPNTGVAITSEEGDDITTDVVNLAVPVSGNTSVWADFDDDGDIDVALGSARGDKLVVYYNSLVPPEVDDEEENPLALSDFDPYYLQRNLDFKNITDDVQHMVAVDVTGDGLPDLVTVSIQNDAVYLYPNINGQGGGNEIGRPGSGFGQRIALAESLDGVNHVEAVDFNGNGRMDLVVSVFNESSVVLLLNDGNNQFTQVVVADDLNEVNSVAVGDLNGDRIPDIIATSAVTDRVILYYTESVDPPSFREFELTTESDRVQDLAIADFDQDLIPDIGAVSLFNNTLNWYRAVVNIQDNSFLIAEDLTEPELFIEGQLDYHTIYLWQVIAKAGPFRTPSELFSFITQETRVEVQSLFSPLVVETDGFLNIRYRLNNVGPVGAPPGGGRFETHIWLSTDDIFTTETDLLFRAISSSQLGAGRQGLVDITVDLNLNPIPEGEYTIFFVVDGPDDPFMPFDIATFTNHKYGEDIFTAEEQLVVANIPQKPFGPTPANFSTGNDKGVTFDWADAQFAKQYDLFLVEGQFVGRNYFPQEVTNLANQARVVRPIDVEGDGDMDILAGYLGAGGNVDLYTNSGGLFPTFSRRSITQNVNTPVDLEVADLDLDGDDDFVIASLDDSKLLFMLNDGAGVFTENTVTTGVFGPQVVHLADLDGNGFPDVISGSVINRGLLLSLNLSGDPLAFLDIPLDASREMYSVAEISSGDFDLDGDTDLIVSYIQASQNVEELVLYTNILSNQLGFVMTPIVLDAESGGSRGLDVGDLDGDGDLDIVSVNTNAGTTTWYENTDPKTNTFVKRTISANTTGARGLDLINLDRDGDLDVVVANTGLNLLTAFLNNGGSPPSFSPLNLSFNAPSVWSVAQGDFNGDQRIDVLTGNSGSGVVNWFANIVDFSFADVDTGLDGADLTASEYDRPADLKVLTPYRWQVDAKNLLRKTSGDVWTFTTGLPDLELRDAFFTRDAANENLVNLIFTVSNVGKSRATTGTVQLFISKRGEPIRSNGDIVIGHYEYGTILPGQNLNAQVQVNLDDLPNQPSGVAIGRPPEGVYFIGYDADILNTEPDEFSERNVVKNRFAILYVPRNSALDWTHYE